MDAICPRDRNLTREGHKSHVFLATVAYLTAIQMFCGCTTNSCCYWNCYTWEQSLWSSKLFRLARLILPKDLACLRPCVLNSHRGVLRTSTSLSRERLRCKNRSFYLRSITCTKKWVACFCSKWTHFKHWNSLVVRKINLTSNQNKKTIIRMIRRFHLSSFKRM